MALFVSVALYLLARSGRVEPFEGRRTMGAIVATLSLGLMALGFGGVEVVAGFGRLLPQSPHPTPDEQLLAYSSTLLTAAGVVTSSFLISRWLVRPFRIDDGALSAAEQTELSPAAVGDVVGGDPEPAA